MTNRRSATLEREAQHLLGHDDGDLAQLADLVQRLRDVLDDRRLDAFGGLVEQQHLGFGDQCAGDRELLLLAAGQVAALARRMSNSTGNSA
jgi:hypothetical protein